MSGREVNQDMTYRARLVVDARGIMRDTTPVRGQLVGLSAVASTSAVPHN